MQISDLPKVMFISLMCTLVIELTISYILKYRNKDLLNVLLVNIITNPLLNSIIVAINYYYGLRIRNVSLIVLELLVLFIEGFIYKKYLCNRKINGYLLSLILNVSSYGLGLLINSFIYKWGEICF